MINPSVTSKQAGMGMFVSPYIASGGGDFFPLVIIVVAILAQIIKASKSAKPTITQPGQSDSSGGGDYTAPEDELKKFLENLSGGAAKPAEEQPPSLPPPVPKPKIRIVKPQQPVRPLVVQAAPPKVTAESDTPYEIAVPSNVVAQAAKPSFSEPAESRPDNMLQNVPTTCIRKETNHFRAMITCQLSSSDSLKKAILLREILGPCLALRRVGTGAPGL